MISPASNWLKANIATSIEERQYQVDAWGVLWNARANGQKRAIVQLATGLGKTSIAVIDVLHYIKDESENNNPRVLFVSHMSDISKQAMETFKRMIPDLKCSFYHTQKPLNDITVTFSTFQALHRTLNKIPSDYFDYIIWDEAHHIEAETFKQVRKHFTPEFELGLTATPERADGLDVYEYFGQPIFSKSLAEGVAEGWLSAIDYHIVFDETIKKAMQQGFELSTLKEIRDLFRSRVRNEVIATEVIERRHKIGLDKAKTIVFCQNIKAAESIAALLDGVVYHSGLSFENRIATLKGFRSGKIKVICTVDMFNEGIDIPDAKLVVFLRSTSSKTIFEQQLGRGLRLYPGKKSVTVLDFVANVERIEFVRELGHSTSRANEKTTRRSGSLGSDTEFQQQTSYFEPSSFVFEDQTIELLERYKEIQSRHHLKTHQVVAEYEKLKSVTLVSQKFSVSTTAIYKHLKKAGIDTSGHMKKRDDEAIIKKYFELKSANKTGKLFGIQGSTVLEKVKKSGHMPLPAAVRKFSDKEIIDAYEASGKSIRAASARLNVSRKAVTKYLKEAGVDTSRKHATSISISEFELNDAYSKYEGDISQMVKYFNEKWATTGKWKWAIVYKALDKYEYIVPSQPVSSAQAAAAYYKFGTAKKAGEALGVSGTYIIRLSRQAKYISKYKVKEEKV